MIIEFRRFFILSFPHKIRPENWRSPSWRIICLYEQLPACNTLQGNINQNKAKPAHGKGKEYSTKWLHLPRYILHLPKQLFHPWPSHWKPLLKQLLGWHLDWARVISSPECLCSPRGLPSSRRVVLASQASPPRAGNNIYQLQFSPSSNISSGSRDGDPAPP